MPKLVDSQLFFINKDGGDPFPADFGLFTLDPKFIPGSEALNRYKRISLQMIRVTNGSLNANLRQLALYMYGVHRKAQNITSSFDLVQKFMLDSLILSCIPGNIFPQTTAYWRASSPDEYSVIIRDQNIIQLQFELRTDFNTFDNLFVNLPPFLLYSLVLRIDTFEE